MTGRMVACLVLMGVGAALYLLVPRLSEFGRILFFVGAFWTAYLLGVGHARLPGL